MTAICQECRSELVIGPCGGLLPCPATLVVSLSAIRLGPAGLWWGRRFAALPRAVAARSSCARPVTLQLRRAGGAVCYQRAGRNTSIRVGSISYSSVCRGKRNNRQARCTSAAAPGVFVSNTLNAMLAT